jgi:DNA adenine methylase
MKPVHKWVGGKTQILSDVLSRFPREIVNYHEPFVGGGSVLLGLLASPDIRVTGTVYASDVNPILINFYQTVQTRLEDLLAHLRTLVQEYTASEDREAFYYRTRDAFNQTLHDTVESAALFLFLNKTCFRGVYREGPRGFNVPFGHYKTTDVLDESNLRSVSAAIQKVVFTCESFEKALVRPTAGDFVYADPPYIPETQTSFVGYVAGGFAKHALLFETLKTLPCPFLLSNSNVPLVRESFPAPYTVDVITVRRAIHSKKPESQTTETLTHSPTL